MARKKLDLRKISRPVREALGWAWNAVKEVERAPHELLAQPETRLEQVKAVVERDLEQAMQADPDGWHRKMFELALTVPDAKWRASGERLSNDIARTRRRVEATAAGADLMRLFDAAEAAVGGGPALLLGNPFANVPAALRALGRLERLRGTQGEERALLLLDATAAVAEQVYHPFLNSVWKLAALAEGKMPDEPPNFGGLVHELNKRLGTTYPALIERDAAKIRNAISHDHARYLVRDGAIEMHTVSGWRRTFSLDELEALTAGMFQIGHELFMDAKYAYIQSAWLRRILPLVPVMSRAIVSNDQSALDMVGQEFQRHQDDMLSGIRALQAQIAAVPPAPDVT